MGYLIMCSEREDKFQGSLLRRLLQMTTGNGFDKDMIEVIRAFSRNSHYRDARFPYPPAFEKEINPNCEDIEDQEQAGQGQDKRMEYVLNQPRKRPTMAYIRYQRLQSLSQLLFE